MAKPKQQLNILRIIIVLIVGVLLGYLGGRQVFGVKKTVHK
jgi:uncharacterized protein YneF (UPF0154 family)